MVKVLDDLSTLSQAQLRAHLADQLGFDVALPMPGAAVLERAQAAGLDLAPYRRLPLVKHALEKRDGPSAPEPAPAISLSLPVACALLRAQRPNPQTFILTPDDRAAHWLAVIHETVRVSEPDRDAPQIIRFYKRPGAEAYYAAAQATVRAAVDAGAGELADLIAPAPPPTAPPAPVDPVAPALRAWLQQYRSNGPGYRYAEALAAWLDAPTGTPPPESDVLDDSERWALLHDLAEAVGGAASERIYLWLEGLPQRDGCADRQERQRAAAAVLPATPDVPPLPALEPPLVLVEEAVISHREGTLLVNGVPLTFATGYACDEPSGPVSRTDRQRAVIDAWRYVEERKASRLYLYARALLLHVLSNGQIAAPSAADKRLAEAMPALQASFVGKLFAIFRLYRVPMPPEITQSSDPIVQGARAETAPAPLSAEAKAELRLAGLKRDYEKARDARDAEREQGDVSDETHARLLQAMNLYSQALPYLQPKKKEAKKRGHG